MHKNVAATAETLDSKKKPQSDGEQASSEADRSVFEKLASQYFRWKLDWVVTLGGFVLVLLVLAATAIRIQRNLQIPGPFDPARQGYCDFQNGVYFPSMAFLQHVSPYGYEFATEYPVARSMPFFSPLVFTLHAPFALLPLNTSSVVYFLWTIVVIAGIAFCIGKWIAQVDSRPGEFRWDVCACTALCMVATRGGQQTLFTGYFTFELVLASLVAVHYGKTRPWWSALALIIVSCKPNYVLPLGILLLCRGNYKAVFWGGVFSILLALASFAWIMPEGGVSELLGQIEYTQEIHRFDEIERPVNTWIRVDVLAIVAKWLAWDPAESVYLAVMFVLLFPVAIALRIHHKCFPNDSGSAVGLSGGLVLLSSVVSVYHHVYDSLVVIGLIAGLLTLRLPKLLNDAQTFDTGSLGASGDSDTGLASRGFGSWVIGRWLMAAALLVPGLNYLSSQKFLLAYSIDGWAHKLITSVNALLLLAVWFVMIGMLFAVYRSWAAQRRQSSDAVVGSV